MDKNDIENRDYEIKKYMESSKTYMNISYVGLLISIIGMFVIIWSDKEDIILLGLVVIMLGLFIGLSFFIRSYEDSKKVIKLSEKLINDIIKYLSKTS